MKEEIKEINFSNEIPDYIGCPKCGEVLEIKHIIDQALQEIIDEIELIDAGTTDKEPAKPILKHIIKTLKYE